MLSGVNLSVAAGESVAVMGPSGSGKSTLLGCILGLIKPSAGHISVVGQSVDVEDKRGLARLRQRHLGVVFQFGELLPELSPTENVALPALLAGRSRDDAFGAADALLAQLGVATSASLTVQLSGGERQRVAVARALINEPKLVVADEPTGSLDATSRNGVADLLFEVPRRRGCGLLVVTHDAVVAGRADVPLELSDGVLTAIRPPASP